MVKHKGVYCDFVKSGPKWKVAMYCLVNKIYIEEVIPDSMKTTKLTKLYKRKGALESTTLKRSRSSRLSETIIMLRYGLNASPAVLLYNTQRGIGIGCVFPMCSGIDEWSHLFECIFYDTKVRGHIINKADIV